MPRPPQPKHPFTNYLREYHSDVVGEATVRKYGAIVIRMEKSRENPGTWLESQRNELDGTKEKAYRNTIGVLRSAICYYLRWKHFEKTGEELNPFEVESLGSKLERSSSGVRGKDRRALSTRQYRKYLHHVIKLRVPDQIITVLLLLPLTGLRISEACGLQAREVVRAGDEWTLDIRGKGDKPRTVPLTEAAKALVEPYVENKTEGDYLFKNPKFGMPGSTRLDLSTAQVRAVVRDYLQQIPELKDIVPHVLRHQFATTTIKVGVDVFTVKEILGHRSTTTLERYAHPDEDMKREAVERAGEVLGKDLLSNKKR